MHTQIQHQIDLYISQKTDTRKVIVIYGPTACGKTSLSLDVAEYVGGEIISADSRQIYRGLDIGTGKISPSEMRDIRHHMIDIIDVDTTFSMVNFRRYTDTLDIEDSTPIILCGGTGLYIDAYLYDMACPDTPPNWEYRRELESYRITHGNIGLWKLLEEKDPLYARELLPENYRYIMRGLEVIEATGRSKREAQDTKKLRYTPLFLTPYTDSVENRKILYTNIDARVEKMFQDGLIEETLSVRKLYPKESLGLMTIGYKEVSEMLDGRITQKEALESVQQHSRNYAKRQITWNKKYLTL